MTDRAAALAYLKSSEKSLWRWDDNGTRIAWSEDGGTIAFRDELTAIVRHL